jgi:hypothetical protein
MIKWRRTTIEVDGSPRLVYLADEKDWAQWSIDRVPVDGTKRTFIYHVKYSGEKIGPSQSRLDMAKRLVERQGREPQPVLTLEPGEHVEIFQPPVHSYAHELPRRESKRTPGAVVVTHSLGDSMDMDVLTRIRDGLRNL